MLNHNIESRSFWNPRLNSRSARSVTPCSILNRAFEPNGLYPNAVMSAYGAITAPAGRPVDLLPPTTWELPAEPAPPPDGKLSALFRLALYHLRLDDAPGGLVEYTHRVFTAEVEAGRTYPQEGPHGRAAFEAYFWAADVIVAIGTTTDSEDGSGPDVEAARAGRSWEDALVGFYYVKPNYPGRSSHVRFPPICICAYVGARCAC